MATIEYRVRRPRKKVEIDTQSDSLSKNSQTIQQKKMNIKMKQEFKDYNDRRYHQRALNRIRQFIANNIISEYKPQYDFEELWEKQKGSSSEDKLIWFMKQSSHAYFILSFLFMVLRMLLVWYTSMRKVFQISFLNYLYLPLIAIVIGEMALVIIKICKSNMAYKKTADVRLLLKNAFLLMYCALVFSSILDREFITILFDIAYIFIEYKECANLYKIFRRILISSTYKNQLNIFDLFVTLLIVGHIFSVVLYGVILFNPNPNDNWLSKVPQPLENWEDKYIYSLYFAYSTMLTVGYGDISPVSKIEILAILVVQIVGVAFFGYVVSQIGSNLSSIRKSQVQLQHNIGMIEHLSQYYDLNKDVTIKVRDYLVANQIAQQKFKTQDEDKFLSKISQDLRQDITNQTNTKLIRKSLFFICGWSKNFRNEMAKKLMKKVFSPNDFLLDNDNSQIFIIQKGQVQIYAQRRHRGKVCLRKKIKSIISKPSDQILTNVYGYSRFLTLKSIPLIALAKSCVVAYILDRKSFQQVVKHESIDNQYYFELKHKMQTLKIAEQMQVPKIINSRQHYQPNPYFLIQKKQRQANAKKTIAVRSSTNRLDRKCHLYVGVDEVAMSNFKIKIDKERVSAFISQQQVSPQIFRQFEVQREYKNYFTKGNLDQKIFRMENAQIGI